MKTLAKVLGAILIGLVALLLVLRITGLGPHQRIPGLWLKGELVTTPVTDWSFTDAHETIQIQTNTWYWLPHSVTTYCNSYNGQLYVTSVYRAGMEYPKAKNWTANVARDPHVRLKIGDKVYDRTLQYVSNPELRAAVLAVKTKKYPQQKIAKDSTVNIFHVVENQ